MNTIDEACDKLRNHLQCWYDKNKHKSINSFDLYYAKQEFVKANSEYEKYDFDIIFGFKTDQKSYRPRCVEGCCQEQLTVCGIYVIPVNWERTKDMAGLKQIKECG